MKIEILFYFIFQGEDPLQSLDDIFPEGWREGRAANALCSFSSRDIG